MANGRIVYEGKSELNGDDIVAILTLSSNNNKTGNMAQLWILTKDTHPFEALHNDKDVAVCGNCPFRAGKGGACYVEVWKAPSQVWKAYKQGKYESGLQGLSPKNVRLGAYGDPAALPYAVLISVIKACKMKATGYTHQWRTCDQRLAKFCRASCDSEKDYFEAKEKGWKTFRTVLDYNEMLKTEKMCMNAKDGRQCQDCLMCGGKGPDFVIKAHGPLASRLTKQILEGKI